MDRSATFQLDRLVKGFAMPRVLGIICVLSIAAFAGSARAAAIDAAKVAAVEKAAAEFLVLAKDSYKTGQPPRETDPGSARRRLIQCSTRRVSTRAAPFVFVAPGHSTSSRVAIAASRPVQSSPRISIRPRNVSSSIAA
jgi:hypothetical protein